MSHPDALHLIQSIFCMMFAFAPLAMCAHFDGNPKKHKTKTTIRRGNAGRRGRVASMVKDRPGTAKTRKRAAPQLSDDEQALLTRYKVGRDFKGQTFAGSIPL